MNGWIAAAFIVACILGMMVAAWWDLPAIDREYRAEMERLHSEDRP